MRKINVLFLAEELRVGGAETYFYSLENNIDRNLFNFYTMAVDGDGKSNICCPENFESYSFSIYDRFKKSKAICKEKNIDIIHVNSLRLAFVASLIKRTQNVKIIYTKHNITALEKLSKKIYATFLNSNIDIVNVICEKERSYLEKIGVKKKLLTVVYNGIQIENFKFCLNRRDEKFINIGILARVDKVKNHRLFLSIAEEIHENHPEIRFFIGGDGPDKSATEEIITRKKMEDYVEMSGYVKASEFLGKMDYSMLVSQREVFPMSIIEAMACGTIVISKNLGGIGELVNENSGYLIEGENVYDYVEAIEKSICRDETNKKIFARKKVEKYYTIQKMTTDIEEMYRRIGN